MNRPTTDAFERRPRRTRNLVRLASWTGAYVGTMALATFGPEFLWEAGWLTLAAILVNLAAGVGMIGANIQHVKELDELMQRIQLEAMGLALGVGVVGGLSYSLLDLTNLAPFDAEIAFLVMLIGITYLASSVIGYRRYR